jgi:hypothetical protein
MATKAQQYRSQQQLTNSEANSATRAKPKKKKKATKPDPRVDARVFGVSGAGKATVNFGKRSKNNGGPALEVSEASSTPSRKSTRSSAGRVKQATNLTRRKTREVHSPKERAARAAARS